MDGSPTKYGSCAVTSAIARGRPYTNLVASIYRARAQQLQFSMSRRSAMGTTRSYGDHEPDHEVFLVSRIKEEYDQSGAHEDSIAEGMEKTGPLITGAAVLMVAVFAGFAFSGVLPIQMLGFGMAIAIALDSTVIRMLLVPVTMKLLGRASWWFPGRRKVESSDPQKHSDNSIPVTNK